MRYLEESQGVTDFSPLSGSPPPCPLHLGEVNCPQRPHPPPLSTSHSFCARHLLSKQGRQFTNSPHSYMIDNRKPLSDADDFFSSACAAPHVSRLTGSPTPKTATVYVNEHISDIRMKSLVSLFRNKIKQVKMFSHVNITLHCFLLKIMATVLHSYCTKMHKAALLIYAMYPFKSKKLHIKVSGILTVSKCLNY